MSQPIFQAGVQTRVSMVGTVHVESGLANVAELLAILERFQPEAIFAEISLADVKGFTDGSCGSLESTAVGLYLESHAVDVVPVDLARPDNKFFDDAEHMFRAVERTSPEYRRMIDRHSADTRAGGFSYLNSDRCIQSWANIYREVLATIDWIGDRWLREIYNQWTRTNERRDRGMVENIENYVSRNAVLRGVFLVGTAHRKSIIDKVLVRRKFETPQTDWHICDSLDELL